jgi:hypothetical protein
MASEQVYSTNPFSRRNPGTIASRMAGINASLQGSSMGRAFVKGAAESFGFYTPGSLNTPVGSFLGIRESMDEIRNPGKLARSRIFASSSKVQQAGRVTRTGMATKLASKTFWKAIPLISTGMFAYEGYQNNGLMGAASGVGESVLINAAVHYGRNILTNPLTLTVAGIAAAGYGMYRLGEAGRAHAKGLKELEMTSQNTLDAIGSIGAGTMRQRALMALNNTHINGRIALGNEAMLMHGDRSSGMRRF